MIKDILKLFFIEWIKLVVTLFGALFTILFIELLAIIFYPFSYSGKNDSEKFTKQKSQ